MKKTNTKEYILVCLSSAPSNARIIETAAKMAKAFGASFTALYVQTPASELMLEKVEELPTAVDADIHSFIDLLEQEPFDQNSLKRYGLKNEDIMELLKQVFG